MIFGQSSAADVSDQNQGELIFDVSASEFEERVIEASLEKPVIAYFTAPWCGPCKQLGPMIDKTVQEAGGLVVMGKINVDDNQELAQALRIQSVPTVFAFFQGKPVDAFQGAMPESEIKSFIDKVIQIAKEAEPGTIDIPAALQTAGEALAEEDFQTAQVIYSQVLSQDEKNVQAYVGLVRLFIAAGKIEQAREIADNLPEDIANDHGFDEARSALELAEIKPEGSVEDLAIKVTQNSDDHKARYDLALAEFSSGRKEEAIDSLLEIVRRDPEWNEEAARQQLLKFFEAMGPADPLTMSGRRKLSSILFS